MHLETSRLVITPLGLEHLEDYAAMVADPQVVRYLNEGVPRTLDYATQYLEDLVKLQKQKGFTRYGVFDREDQSLLGHCGFKDIEGRIDIGWTYVQSAWGKGIGTEAARAVLSCGFKSLGFTTVTARTDPANPGSIGVMRSSGMKEFDTFIWRPEDDPDHPGYPVVEYRITSCDWHSRN
jgi:RimJ/RimL family protein N-acetyltransferase